MEYKKNGFEKPYHPLQVVSWVVMSLHSVMPGICIYLFFCIQAKIALLVVFYTALGLVTVLGFLATNSNPTAVYFNCQSKSQVSLVFCSLCRKFVSESAKHCGQCKRCVDNFDHHCKWVNNCIGGKNYKLFIALIVCLETYLALNFGIEVVTLSGHVENEYAYTFIVADCVLGGCLLLLNGYLIVLHTWLWKKGLTTYQYIMVLRMRNGMITPQSSSFSESSPRSESSECKKSVEASKKSYEEVHT